MKPLYLQGKPGMRVVLDTPALSIVVPDKSRQLFPLSRISRVVVSGNVDWSMSALLACADTGISVIFLTDCGAVRCRCLGVAQSKQNIVQQFVTLFQRVDSEQHYQDWQRAMQRMAVRSSARRVGVTDWQVAEARELSIWVNESFSRDWLPVLNLIQGFLLSSILSYLGDFGLDARCEYLVEGQINLAEDLSQLLLWDFYPALLTWNGRCVVTPEHELIIKFYEARNQRVEHLLHGLLNRLHQCLLESV